MPARSSPPPRAAELAATAVAVALHVGLLAVGLVMPERAQAILAGGSEEADTWLEIEELRPGSPAAAGTPAAAAEPVPASESGLAAATAPAPAPAAATEPAPA
ncbi:MAG TPA: hypothetical protein VLS89_17885, partial [Candidatus Nanopelagicales bacterium]|nr:hypothetical protein [Candidatus Nanopelagicales bacterium]